MRTNIILAAAFVVAVPAFAADATSTTAGPADQGVEEPPATPTLGAQVVQGCFSSWGDLTFNSTPSFNSKSKCAYDTCYAGGFLVAASGGGNECYCGHSYPPKDTLVEDSNCDTPCPGYGTQACGGIGFYTVYNTGIKLSVEHAVENTTDTKPAVSSAPPSPAAPSSTASGGQATVVYVTATPTANITPVSTKSSPPIGGIVAGVVAGVVVIAALAAGLWFWMRQKRNREIEEEHRRNAAVNSFMGAKPPSSSGGYSIDTDARMDPVLAQRRMSSGSIADNQDYSRRILRVTNA